MEVIFEYMRASQLPKSGVYIIIYHQRHKCIFTLNIVNPVYSVIADAFKKPVIPLLACMLQIAILPKQPNS